MRVIYIPIAEKVWLSNLQQRGHGFSGERFQRGYGLGAIFGPLLRTILPVVKGVGKAVGKQALRTGAAVASDVLQGGNFKEAVKARGKQGVKRLVRKAVRAVKQRGRGLGVRTRATPLKSIKGKKKPAKRVTRKRKTRRDALGFY